MLLLCWGFSGFGSVCHGMLWWRLEFCFFHKNYLDCPLFLRILCDAITTLQASKHAFLRFRNLRVCLNVTSVWSTSSISLCHAVTINMGKDRISKRATVLFQMWAWGSELSHGNQLDIWLDSKCLSILKDLTTMYFACFNFRPMHNTQIRTIWQAGGHW